MNKQTMGKWKKKVEIAELLSTKIESLNYTIGILLEVRNIHIKQLNPLMKELKQARKDGVFNSEEKRND